MLAVRQDVRIPPWQGQDSAVLGVGPSAMNDAAFLQAQRDIASAAAGKLKVNLLVSGMSPAGKDPRMAENEKITEALADAQLEEVAGGGTEEVGHLVRWAVFVCPDCETEVDVELEKPMGAHRKWKQIPQPCSKCGRVFSSVSELKRSKRERYTYGEYHTVSGEF